MAVMQGDSSAAEEHYRALRSTEGMVLLLALMCSDRLLGLLSQTMGKPDQAAAHFEDALAFCRKAGYRPELAWSCCDYADALVLRGGRADRMKAVPLLGEGMAISIELGMRPLQERIAALQERAQSGAGRAPAFPDGLTRREVEVLRLIALGKTDRDIAEELVIGVRTVTTHVSNILTKIRAANRTEAAAYATRQRLA